MTGDPNMSQEEHEHSEAIAEELAFWEKHGDEPGTVAAKDLPANVIGVPCSVSRRVHDLMTSMGFALLRAEGVGHPSKISLVYDAGEYISTLTIDDTEKPQKAITLSDPCPHPARGGSHEIYVRLRGASTILSNRYCRTCGAAP